MTYPNRACDNARMAPPPNPAERVRQRLLRWIDDTKITQRDFAALFGKTQAWLEKILQGENHVRLEDLDVVAGVLRTTASDLLRQTDERYQVDCSPTEIRILEAMRQSPDVARGVLLILSARRMNSGSDVRQSSVITNSSSGHGVGVPDRTQVTPDVAALLQEVATRLSAPTHAASKAAKDRTSRASPTSRR